MIAVNKEAPRTDYTSAEYLALEEASVIKHEYIDGEIIPMTGGTPNHNDITGNFYTFLKLALRGKGYKVFMTDLRLWIPQFNIYTYPDVMVIKGQPVLQDNRNDTVVNPMLIVEVLSKSTKNYDLGDKFDYYRSIPNFAEYILVDQYRYGVKQYAKADDGRWWLSEYQGKNDSFTFASLDLEIGLDHIYEEIEFSQD
ncbi:MAG: Uma2 family endonuclease [Cyanobacteria bacterium P01_A01_bin.40]